MFFKMLLRFYFLRCISLVNKITIFKVKQIMEKGNKLTITVCMGSSCFARGNAEILAMIEDVLHQKKLEDIVDLQGARCEGKCAFGPHIKINGKSYSEMSRERLKNLLSEILEG